MKGNQAFIPQLEKELRPLFKKMYKEIQDVDQYWLFCATWGKYFPTQPKSGILFYGRAPNGWKDYDEYCGDPDAVFSFLFNREDQVEWMPSNTHRPFVNLIKQVSEKYYPEEWNEHIAWSNVCKVAPDTRSGTPSNALWNEQYSHIVNMIEVETRILSPKVIVFVTGATASSRWDSPLFEIDRFKDHKECLCESIVWGEANSGRPLTALGGVIDDTIIIITDRPEARPIEPHAKAITDLIDKLWHK